MTIMRWAGREVRRVLRAINIHAVMWHLTRNLWTQQSLTEEVSDQMLVKIETRGAKHWQSVVPELSEKTRNLSLMALSLSL